ncbi:MAG: hypothetical protein H5T61_13245 [Thermoflexales bacterium]|nr:hypothetical protein [Thermoflexales bacterium]
METDFTHPELNREVTAIGGHYVWVKEDRLPFEGREVLYLVGYAVLDTTCCGVGGFACALVPGFVVEWKSGVSPEGRPVSRVERIRDEAAQAEIRRCIRDSQRVHQVNFL